MQITLRGAILGKYKNISAFASTMGWSKNVQKNKKIFDYVDDMVYNSSLGGYLCYIQGKELPVLQNALNSLSE